MLQKSISNFSNYYILTNCGICGNIYNIEKYITVDSDDIKQSDAEERKISDNK